MNSEKKFFIAVKRLLFYENRFLIIQRTTKARGEYFYWELPGGRLEFGESPEQTLHREILEETGLIVKCLYLINVWNFLKNEDTEIIGITYLCRTEKDTVKLSEEHGDYAWILYEDIERYNISPGIIEQLKRLNRHQINSDLQIMKDIM